MFLLFILFSIGVVFVILFYLFIIYWFVVVVIFGSLYIYLLSFFFGVGKFDLLTLSLASSSGSRELTVQEVFSQ